MDLKPDLVADACPFCNVMLTDGVQAMAGGQGGGDGADQGPAVAPQVEVTDISELLLRSCAQPALTPTVEGTTR